MQTKININIINKKTKENNFLSKFLDGLIPLNEGNYVSTGIYLATVRSVNFEIEKCILNINLKDEIEENDKILSRIEMLKGRFGWE